MAIDEQNKPNPDDRSDNEDKIQSHINFTLHNIDLADDMMKSTGEENMKQALWKRNERRGDVLAGIGEEFRHEVLARKHKDE